MSFSVRSRNCHIPLRSLPTVVIHHVAQYLNRRDLANMTQVDRYLREVFNSPQLWKDVKIHIPDKKIDPQVLEILRVRGIRNLDIRNINCDHEITTLPPHRHLERLSLRVTNTSTLEALSKAASNGYLNNLKSLAFGHIDYGIGNQSKVTFLGLFKCLPMTKQVSFEGSNDLVPSPAHNFYMTPFVDKNCVLLTDKVLIISSEEKSGYF